MTVGEIVIEDGELRAIYSDDLLPYIESVRAEFGLSPEDIQINRATRVEPDPTHKAGGNWLVDLTPVGGPVFYLDEDDRPFIKRQDAIDFELRWLTAHWLLREEQDASSVKEEK